MKTYDTIIFDLDGTLLNTIEDLADSVNYALSRAGCPGRTLTEIRSLVGNGAGHLLELCLPGGKNNPQYDQCLLDFRQYYSANMKNKTLPYPAIMELVQQLSQEDYKMAVVSNKFDPAVKALICYYFGDYIKVAIGESENTARKPAPDSVFKALAELGSSADKAIYVGDSEVDIKTAKNAGLVGVSVTWGFKGREFLEANGAKYIIDKPEELLSSVLNVLNAQFGH